MALWAKEGAGDFYLIPEDSYQAVCSQIYDIGHQFSELYGKAAHQCIIIWEIPDERNKFTKDNIDYDYPRQMSNFYTVSLHEKARLRKDLESWRGKAFSPDELAGFDIHKLIGANCMLQIIHKSKDNKTRAVIASVTKLPKSMTSKQPEGKTVVYSLEDGQWPETTPDFIVKKIKESEEWKTSVSNKLDEPAYAADTAGDNEPPF
jgi:hypothetical protein